MGVAHLERGSYHKYLMLITEDLRHELMNIEINYIIFIMP